MISPKQKARELISRFDVKYQYNFITGSIPVSMHDSVIKQCALICVDEILKSSPCVIKAITPNGKKGWVGNSGYWQEVKTEIEKL